MRNKHKQAAMNTQISIKTNIKVGDCSAHSPDQNNTLKANLFTNTQK